MAAIFRNRHDCYCSRRTDTVAFFEIEKGDVNGDGNVNSTDVVWLRRFLLKLVEDFPVPSGKQAADMNDDGNINSTDMIALKRKVLKIPI